VQDKDGYIEKLALSVGYEIAKAHGAGLKTKTKEGERSHFII
jgi:hypothetical protein